MPDPGDDVLARLILAVLDGANRPLTAEEVLAELERRFVTMTGGNRERGH